MFHIFCYTRFIHLRSVNQRIEEARITTGSDANGGGGVGLAHGKGWVLGECFGAKLGKRIWSSWFDCGGQKSNLFGVGIAQTHRGTNIGNVAIYALRHLDWLFYMFYQFFPAFAHAFARWEAIKSRRFKSPAMKFEATSRCKLFVRRWGARPFKVRFLRWSCLTKCFLCVLSLFSMQIIEIPCTVQCTQLQKSCVSP